VPHVRTSVRGPKKMGEAHDRSSSTILQTKFLAGILFGRFASFSDMTLSLSSMVLTRKMRKQARLTGSKHLTLASRGN
jgi:hypothetical protein